MMLFVETLLSVTLNAAGIMPSANNRFPLPNVNGWGMGDDRTTQLSSAWFGSAALANSR
jgi:hypothetical protein